MHLRALLVLSAAAALLAGGLRPLGANGFDRRTAGFEITFHGERSAYKDTTVVAMPGAAMVFDASGPAGEYTLKTEHGSAIQQKARQWRWVAPARPGTYTLTFKGPGLTEAHDEIVVHAFVMVPATQVKNGMLNGYRIGAYPATPLKGNPLYLPPPGFIEVTRENQDTKVSPHFRLKQFLCKQDAPSAFPKYVVLKERLPLKLEAVLALVNDLGVRVDTLNVMSAYRTPFYNHAIGDVKYSMHQWGSAADVYVDPQNNSRMVDLNKDRRVDIGDAKFLYDAIERMLGDKAHRHLQGGMGYYPATSAHPPFVHVDVRGTAARWKG
jgi:hypothetical protein